MAESVQKILAAGETVELGCETAAPQIKVGERLYVGADAVLVALKVQDKSVIFGPLKSGQFEVTLPCGNSGANFQVSVNLPRMDQIPEREAPLPPLPFAFPLWLWLAFLAALLLAAGGSFWAYWRKQKRKKAPTTAAPPPPPPDEALQRFLKAAGKNSFALRELYVEGNDRLRAFLQFRLGFDASAETTREFLGVLQAAMAKKRVSDPRLQAWAQSALTQSDGVRFAGDTPPPEAQKTFVNTLQELYNALPPPPPSATASASKSASASASASKSASKTARRR